MRSFETLRPEIESAYFESFSGVSPLLDTPLPNEPDWTTFKPDPLGNDLNLGLAILNHNWSVLSSQGIDIPTEQTPQIIQEMLGLSDEDAARFLKRGFTAEQFRDGDFRAFIPQMLHERFLVARFISDNFRNRLDPEAYRQEIAHRFGKYDGRDMIGMIGDGEGARFVGIAYQFFD